MASSNAALHQRLSTVPHALSSLRSIVTSALATLNTRWLVMEKTAMDAGGRLHELRSRDGDWFLDELLTMSMNVTQMVELLEITSPVRPGACRNVGMKACSNILTSRTIRRRQQVLKDSRQ